MKKYIYSLPVYVALLVIATICLFYFYWSPLSLIIYCAFIVFYGDAFDNYIDSKNAERQKEKENG